MKKTLFVLAIAAVLVFVFAGSAFAFTPSPSYVAWDASGVNSAGPHADYQAATTKCAVCHSVHAAPQVGYVGSVPVAWTATGPNTQLLLRSSVADSCRFCHIDTSIGGIQLYGGAAGVYGTWAGPGHSGSGGSACVNCHAVHGANTYKGDNTAKILRVAASGTRVVQTETLGGSGATIGLFPNQAAATAAPGRKYEQQTVFCSQCHRNFSRSADTTLAQNSNKSHSMVPVPSTAFSATNGGAAVQYDAAGNAVAGSVPTVNSGATVAQSANIAVATTGSGTCRSCHVGGGVNQTGVSWNSFPHYTRGYPYFLTNGDTSAGTTDMNGNTGTPIDTETDGNCLLCHSNAGTTF